MNFVKFNIEMDGKNYPSMNFNPKIYTAQERAMRSLKVFFMFFGAAIFSIAIPVLHFFLVPAFLIAAFVMAYIKYKDVGSIDLSNFTCPLCQKNLNEKTLAFRDKDFSGRLRCYDCRKNIFISAVKLSL